jgi:hypothetical protein
MHLPQVLTFLSRRKPADQPPKEQPVSNKEQPFIYTDEQLMARLKFFIGICLALTLTGIVFVVLYSIIFVTQPLNAISPIDQKFFELIIPIATFLTGTLSGIMLAGNKKEDQDAMLAAQKQAASNAADAAKSSAPSPVAPPVTNSWGSTSLGSGFGSSQPGMTGSRVEPSFGAPAFGAPPFGAPAVEQQSGDVFTSSTGKPGPVMPPFPEK